MANFLVTIGSSATHGGVVSECENTFIINGIAVHLHGMKHYCPQCQAIVSAVAGGSIYSRERTGSVIAGDKTTCGANFLGNQALVFSKK
ncbi:PAAR domain-containing protein [Acinetobacter sp.]|uniref:PAAR domain-containing protein n=1 Tax=Acinetobacter sp. TaxID=472 RepID=UPI00388DA5B3